MKSHEALKRELLTREKQYWTAIQQRDAETAARLSEDPCLVVGAQGVGELQRGSLAKMLQQANYDLHSFELDDVRMRALGEDIAVLAYRVDEKLTVDGEPVRLKAYDASVWMRRDGEWTCVLHTESPAGDPFGRKASV